LTQKSDNIETKTQKIFEDKKARREQRRSLLESGDFLGIQGANPRTGLWDISTSSSDPSQMSDADKKKLEDEAKRVEAQKQKYEEAKAKQKAEIARVQALREKQRKEKERRKASKMKQRRHGQWKASEDGWHSLAEPQLSPIVQSAAESPRKGEYRSRTSWNPPY
jgi:hypothetical protein